MKLECPDCKHPIQPQRPNDEFIRRGGFHGAYGFKNLWTFRPYDAYQHLDGKGDPLPDYTVRCWCPRTLGPAIAPKGF